MRASVLAGLAAVTVLAGCGSNLNPANWFGRSSSAPATATAPATAATTAPAGAALPADPRPLVDQVIALQVDRVPGGALVSAIGLPPTQGWFDAELVPERLGIDRRPRAENGVLAFRFVAVPPPGQRRTGTAASREISAGIFLTDQTLAPVRTITVTGARNQRSARR